MSLNFNLTIYFCIHLFISPQSNNISLRKNVSEYAKVIVKLIENNHITLTTKKFISRANICLYIYLSNSPAVF